MKKNLKLIVFTVVLCAVSALNVKVVLDTEHSGDLAMTSLAAIGEGNSGESKPGEGNSGEGGSGEGGSGGISWNCTTITTDVYCQTGHCQSCGREHIVSKWETKDCNRGALSFCYPGYVTTYYTCRGEVYSTTNMTSMSTCSVF